MNPQTKNISVPAAAKAPRALSTEERATLARVADTLIPSHGPAPAASREPGFWDALPTALDARSDAFEDIAATLQALAQTAAEGMWSQLQSLNNERPSAFQALSTVVTWAWLATPGVRNRIGYHGQQPEKAGLEEAAEEISSGILEPVLARDSKENPRWIRR